MFVLFVDYAVYALRNDKIGVEAIRLMVVSMVVLILAIGVCIYEDRRGNMIMMRDEDIILQIVNEEPDEIYEDNNNQDICDDDL